MRLKLDGKISMGILLTNEGNTLRFETILSPNTAALKWSQNPVAHLVEMKL